MRLMQDDAPQTGSNAAAAHRVALAGKTAQPAGRQLTEHKAAMLTMTEEVMEQALYVPKACCRADDASC